MFDSGIFGGWKVWQVMIFLIQVGFFFGSGGGGGGGVIFKSICRFAVDNRRFMSQARRTPHLREARADDGTDAAFALACIASVSARVRRNERVAPALPFAL